MKTLKLGCIFSLALMLSSCTLTPEQQAERKAKQIRAEQDLQVQLAKQCDVENGGVNVPTI